MREWENNIPYSQIPIPLAECFSFISVKLGVNAECGLMDGSASGEKRSEKRRERQC
jgi:hypothetical protein